jgi:hypothetical protein
LLKGVSDGFVRFAEVMGWKMSAVSHGIPSFRSVALSVREQVSLLLAVLAGVWMIQSQLYGEHAESKRGAY